MSDLSSCSSSTAEQLTVSSSLDSLSGGEGEMAPHSPQRGAAGPPPHAPPPYPQPPPAYPQPPPPQWPVAPPNVYVSQVTANVNVHGYMGQYYQPPQPQYAPPQQVDRPPRNHRRDRRGKRAPSPPPQPPPYYVQYPQYYPAAQAQGAPLYHLPVYQPLMYGPYAYPPYYQEYPLPVEGEGDKGPDEYQQEVVMEQEAVDAYYAGAHYAGPPYGPPVDGAVEYMPPMYLPPPPHPPPIPIQPQPVHQSTPHQFNVHAKNFVLPSHQNKSYTTPDKTQEQRTPPANASAPAVSVDSVPIKDLKISKGPGSPKQTEQRPLDNQAKPAVNSEKVSPPPKMDNAKPAWVPNDNKVADATNNFPQAKAFPPMAPTNQVVATSKVPPAVSKTTKGPAAPFSGGKQPAKPLVPQTAVPVQQSASTPKAPFGNRQKKEVANRSPTSEHSENTSSPAPADHSKRDPPLPPSKAPMPISITLHSQGPPLIVTNKSPFGHSRKSAVPEPPPVPQPPPPAPTASDFPPPPTPRNRGDLPPPVVQPQPQPAPGKSWASLFSNKTAAAVPVAAAQPTPVQATEEPASPTTVTPPATASVQKPVAKVPPFDASPSQITSSDKSSPVSRPANATPAISYSEKTSVNAVNNAPVAAKPASPSQAAPEVREVPIIKEATPALPVQPSPFADDPNSYRMGGKYNFLLFTF